MGDEPAGDHDETTEWDLYPEVVKRKQSFEEWFHDRKQIYQQLRAARVSDVLVDAVEDFRFDEGVVAVGPKNSDSPDFKIQFKLDPNWQPDEDLGPRNFESRGRDIHEFITAEDRLRTAGEALAAELHERLDELKAAEVNHGSPVRTHGLLARRAIADAAFDLLNCYNTLGRRPGTALMNLLASLLGVEERRLDSDRRYEAKQKAIRIEAEHPEYSMRKLGSLVGVDGVTIARWRRSPAYRGAVEEQRRREGTSPAS